jgi:glycolate oxidase
MLGTPEGARETVMASAFLADLAPAGDVIVDPDVLETYRHDQAAPGFLTAGTPLAVVRPIRTQQVQAALRAAARHGVPVVPRGAGSGLSGGANAVDGGIVLSLERMNDVLDVDTSSLTATVGPGVINAHLDAAARENGLWYAPDPASREFSTIGGNVATNAGGLCCVKYGVTREALLAAEVVMADGEILRVGRRTRKGVAGYDLAALLCGSEGTLGVITEATVRLMPRARPSSTLAASFTTLSAAGRAIGRIVRHLQPSMLELMDRTTVRAVEDFQPMELDVDAQALLFARSDVSFAEVEWMAAECEAEEASLVVTSDEEAEGRMLMAARRLAYPALERLGATLLDDVAVPLGAITALIEGVETISSRHGVLIATFGHAGDGNMHPTVVYDDHDRDATARARAAFVEILMLALELGGTLAGEHGIGALKREFLAAELGDGLVLQQRIKNLFDPANLLNPGKGL